MVELKPRRALIAVAVSCVALLAGAGTVGAAGAQARRHAAQEASKHHKPAGKKLRKVASFKVKVPPAGGVSLATEVLVVKNRGSKRGLPKRLTLKVQNRKRLARGLTIVGKAWLAKPLVKGHPAYSIVVTILRPTGGVGRARAATGSSAPRLAPKPPRSTPKDFEAYLAAFWLAPTKLGQGGVVFDFPPQPKAPLVLDVGLKDTSVTVTDEAICAALNINPQGDIVPVAGDSSGPIDEVVSFTPTQLAREAALAVCHPPAPAAFYHFMHVPPPSTGCPRATRQCVAPLTYTCSGAQSTLFDNTNTDIVSNGGSAPAFETNGAWCVTYIQTYHWNDGKGSPPGKLGLQRITGSATGLPGEVGPFQSQPSGKDWFVNVPLAPQQVISGRYVCFDSNPATWSQDKQSGGHGFCIVKVVPAVPTKTRWVLRAPFPG